MSNFLFDTGATALDFANTEMVVAREKRDLLEDWSSLVNWSADANLICEEDAKALRCFEGTRQGEDALSCARELRVRLRELAPALSSGQPINEVAMRFVNDLLALRVGHPILELATEGDAFQLRHEIPASEPLHLVACIAQSAAQLLCSAQASQIKKCDNAECTQLFLDTSKNKTRRWCSMAVCGNRSKAALHHQRRKAKQETIT